MKNEKCKMINENGCDRRQAEFHFPFFIFHFSFFISPFVQAFSFLALTATLLLSASLATAQSPTPAPTPSAQPAAVTGSDAFDGPAEGDDLATRLAHEETAQKRAQRMAERANRELADLLEQINDHRLKPTGELLSVDPAHKSLAKIGAELMPEVEKGLYLARTDKDLAGRATALANTVQRQEAMVKDLSDLLGRLSRSAITGAALHRAEKILRDQISLNGDAKVSLGAAFSKQLADLPESLRQKLTAQSEEQLRIGREVVVLDGELDKILQTGPEKQKAGLKAARTLIADKKLAALAKDASDQLAANDAAAADGGKELETQFKALVSILQAATAGAEPPPNFDLLGPGLAELAGKDKELKALLDKLQKMIAEAKLAHHPFEKEELRKLKNMQDELNKMLVDIKTDLPQLDNDELIAKLKDLLQQAFDSMEATGDSLDHDPDPQALLDELKVSLGNLVLAEQELQALLDTLAALQAKKLGKPDDNEQETPAGIALGLGLRLGGNRTGASGPGGVLNPAKKVSELGPQDWGRLPPAVRDQLLQGVKEGFPPEYADLIEQYYQNIAKSATGGK